MIKDPVAGIECFACGKYLTSPIVTVHDCLHSLHKKCVDELLKNNLNCPACNGKITKVTDNPELEKIVLSIDRIAKIINKNHSTSLFVDKLLHGAIKEGEIELVKILIKQNVSVSTLVDGISPLYQACKYGHLEIAEMLLIKGASPTQKNDLSYQYEWDKYGYMQDLERIHNATPIQAAITTGDEKLVKLLCFYGAPFDEPNTHGESPLFVAVRTHKEGPALYFINKGAKINAKNFAGISLIEMAVACQLMGVVRKLTEMGVNLCEQNRDGGTLLHLAAWKENSEILKFLLENGTKDLVNVLNRFQNTPLYDAATSGIFENVKLLVEAGADLTLKYKDKSILELMKEELSKSKLFYEKNLKYIEEGKKVVGNKQIVVDYLEDVMSKKNLDPESFLILKDENKKGSENVVKIENNNNIITLSDGTKMTEPLIITTLMKIQASINGASDGALFLLYDLRDKAFQENDSWKPCPNPFCDTMSILKSNGLIGHQGSMLPEVRSIVKDCIIGKGLEIKLDPSKLFSNL
jgi:ankyrin repeat protein